MTPNPWLEAAFTKNFPGISIRGEFTWQDRPRRVTALYGPSGCGKTTLLRCLAGLERPDNGLIRAFGADWFDAGRQIEVSPQRRRVGFLFQDYQLFPHLNVRDNIGFGVPSGQSRSTEVSRLLERFQLQQLAGHFPRQLSGGQQQRVALARVLAAQPRLLLLDEPLSALDGPTRNELRLTLRDWLHEFQLPALIVSHDAIDVQTLAEDVIVMDRGQPQQTGSVIDVWQRPLNKAVARIVGFENLLPVTIIRHDQQMLQVAHGAWRFSGVSQGVPPTDSVAIASIRAEDIRCSSKHPDHDATSGAATIQEIIPERGQWRLRLKHATGHELQAVVVRETVTEAGFRPGIEVHLKVAPEAAIIVHADSSDRSHARQYVGE